MAYRTEWREPENYLIDPKLKKEKDYPPELETLLSIFQGKGPFKITMEANRNLIEAYRKPVNLVERTFKEYFLHRPKIVAIKIFDSQKSEPQIIRDPKEIEKVAQARKNFDPIHKSCIRRVNAKLKYLSPQLLTSDVMYGYELEPFAMGYERKRVKKREVFSSAERAKMFPISWQFIACVAAGEMPQRKLIWGELILWAWLAKVIDSKNGLDPRLVHQCPYCKKVFFSRQRRKFHFECRARFFSEKAVREGAAKKRQKEYRERQKEKLEV